MNRVCVEAAAVATPFVVTQTTGVAGWLPGPGVGVVVPSSDPGALAAALDSVIGGGFARDAERTVEFVRRFAPDRVAAELVELYYPLVAAGRWGTAFSVSHGWDRSSSVSKRCAKGKCFSAA